MARTQAEPGAYEFRAPVNVRAWVISAAVFVGGLYALMYYWNQPASIMKYSLPLMAVLGAAFMLVLWFSQHRSTVRVWLDASGLRMSGPDQTAQAAWADITQIGLAPDHTGVVLARGPGKADRIRIVAPAGVDDADAVMALTREVQAYVARHRTGPDSVTVETAPQRAYVRPNESDNFGFEVPFDPLAPGVKVLGQIRRRKS